MTEVQLTVNGAPVTVDVEPRMTLADMLRDSLRLTGTHLGCEHGVCGACTVLVDGVAVRSCLLFAVQLEGSDVLTVEALGRPQDLHPLQEAFRQHHGLQCGFCTPGFLMSSYELLREQPQPDPATLATELSGNICRCTGYQGILRAVAATAEVHPDGIPQPMNVGRPVLARGGVLPAARREQEVPAAVNSIDVTDFDLSTPAGNPNATVQVETAIAAPVEDTWALLSDVPRLARCLPGAALDDQVGPDTYTGGAQLKVGPMRFRFAGAARVIEMDPTARRLTVVAVGRDATGGSARAEVTVTAAAGPGGGSVVGADARLFLAGRVAQFGRSLVGDVSRQLFNQFGRNVEATLLGTGPAGAAELHGGKLMWQTFVTRLRTLAATVAGRVRGRGVRAGR